MSKSLSSIQQLRQTPVPAISREVQQQTVVCSVCLARYAPSHFYENLLQAPLPILESAFMSMCHFCFRCRRPACPQCWDEVNGICASCVQETKLMFRIAKPLVSNALFSSQRQLQAVRAQKRPAPLVCIQPGTFQDSADIPTTPPPATMRSTDSVRSVSVPTTPSVATSMVDTQKSRLSSRRKHAQKPVSRVAVPPVEQKPVETVSSFWRFLRIVERVLTIIMALALAVVVLLIVAALVSVNANTFITSTLDIDIRAEITYLLQLIQQFH